VRDNQPAEKERSSSGLARSRAPHGEGARLGVGRRVLDDLFEQQPVAQDPLRPRAASQSFFLILTEIRHSVRMKESFINVWALAGGGGGGLDTCTGMMR
jgi:hypothetical protein